MQPKLCLRADDVSGDTVSTAGADPAVIDVVVVGGETEVGNNGLPLITRLYQLRVSPEITALRILTVDLNVHVKRP